MALGHRQSHFIHFCNRGASCCGHWGRGKPYPVPKAGRICPQCESRGNTCSDSSRIPYMTQTISAKRPHRTSMAA